MSDGVLLGEELSMSYLSHRQGSVDDLGVVEGTVRTMFGCSASIESLANSVGSTCHHLGGQEPRFLYTRRATCYWPLEHGFIDRGPQALRNHEQNIYVGNALGTS
jgi:hypothetical protein